jgi:dCTP deaminase
MDVIRTTEKELILDPGQVILGCTRERFAIGTVILDDCYYDVAPMYDGRSTCGRLFLASHITAGYGDVGFRSAWTLEIKNMGMHPLKLYAGMRIGQVSFHLVLGEGGGYAGAYTDQHHQPKPPSLGRERF